MLYVVLLGGIFLYVGLSFTIWWNGQHYLLDNPTSATNELDQTIHMIRFNISKVRRTTPRSSVNTEENFVEVYSSHKQSMTESIRQIVEGEYPVILTNTIATKWKALKWDLWDLAVSSLWPILSNVLSLDHTEEFVLQNQREQSGMLGGLIKNQSFPIVVNMMYLADFLNDLRNASCLYFYSVNFRVFESLAKVKSDTTWRDFSIVEHLVASNNISVAQIAPQLHMLYPGAALRARYSGYHTMRCQLQGEGKYTLFPPEHLRNMYLYPHVHLAHQQSQVEFGPSANSTSPLFPRFKRVRSVTAVLRPGDVLYVPPFWMVSSQATQVLSVALDVLSASHQQLLLAQADQLPLAFLETNQTQDERVVSAQVFLAHLLSRVQDVSSIRKYASVLYASRFAALFPRQGPRMQKSSFACLKNDPARHSAVVSGLDRERVVATAERLATFANDPSVTPPVRWLWLGDYVERVARWAMGDPEGVPLFLLRCLDMEGKIEVYDEEEGPSVMKLNPEL